MHSQFPGHYKKTKEEFKALWENAVFVFDANVLLDLFRYSDETVEGLMTTIEKVKERIWLPFQVASEYHKHLYNIIGEQASHYDSAVKDLNALRSTLDAKRKHPFVSKEVYEKSEITFKLLEKELTEKKAKVINLLNDNPIKDKLANLFSDKVGNSISEAELNSICIEGEERYKKLIPPGYEDSKKPSPEKFGDLVVWKQILSYAKSSDKAIIFVTGDTKSDWFLSESGRTIGPLPELVAEFLKEVGRDFYSYPTHIFLKSANDFLSAGVKKTTLEEVKSFDESSTKVRNSVVNLHKYFGGGEAIDLPTLKSDEKGWRIKREHSINNLSDNARRIIFDAEYNRSQEDKKVLRPVYKDFLKNLIARKSRHNEVSQDVIRTVVEFIAGNQIPSESDFWVFLAGLYVDGEITNEIFDELISFRQ